MTVLSRSKKAADRCGPRRRSVDPARIGPPQARSPAPGVGGSSPVRGRCVACRRRYRSRGAPAGRIRGGTWIRDLSGSWSGPQLPRRSAGTHLRRRLMPCRPVRLLPPEPDRPDGPRSPPAGAVACPGGFCSSRSTGCPVVPPSTGGLRPAAGRRGGTARSTAAAVGTGSAGGRIEGAVQVSSPPAALLASADRGLVGWSHGWPPRPGSRSAVSAGVPSRGAGVPRAGPWSGRGRPRRGLRRRLVRHRPAWRPAGGSRRRRRRRGRVVVAVGAGERRRLARTRWRSGRRRSPSCRGRAVAGRAAGPGHRAGRTRRGRVIGVVGGRGGAGASTLAAALALTRPRGPGCAPCWSTPTRSAAGLDLLLGTEDEAGLRWPELATARGRLPAGALLGGLPRVGDSRPVLGPRGRRPRCRSRRCSPSWTAPPGRWTLVVVDLPRRPGRTPGWAPPAATWSCSSSRPRSARPRPHRVAGRVAALVADTRLVVRGPAPGGLPAEARRRGAGPAAGRPCSDRSRAWPRRWSAGSRRRCAGGVRWPTFCRRFLAERLLAGPAAAGAPTGTLRRRPALLEASAAGLGRGAGRPDAGAGGAGRAPRRAGREGARASATCSTRCPAGAGQVWGLGPLEPAAGRPRGDRCAGQRRRTGVGRPGCRARAGAVSTSAARTTCAGAGGPARHRRPGGGWTRPPPGWTPGCPAGSGCTR